MSIEEARQRLKIAQTNFITANTKLKAAEMILKEINAREQKAIEQKNSAAMVKAFQRSN